MNMIRGEASRQHGQLIRYITANFSSLRGLRRLPFGVYYLLCVPLDGWVFPSAFQTHIFFPLFFALFLVALVLTFVVEMYYTQAFGDVQPSVSPKKVVSFSRIWLWVPVVVGVLLISSLTKQQAPGLLQWTLFVGYPLVMIGSFMVQRRKKDAYGGVPIWPFIIVLLFYVLVPGLIRMDSYHLGLNNFALQDWILGVFLVGSGIYNHLQLTHTLSRISREIHDFPTI